MCNYLTIRNYHGQAPPFYAATYGRIQDVACQENVKKNIQNVKQDLNEYYVDQ